MIGCRWRPRRDDEVDRRSATDHRPRGRAFADHSAGWHRVAVLGGHRSYNQSRSGDGCRRRHLRRPNHVGNGHIRGTKSCDNTCRGASGHGASRARPRICASSAPAQECGSCGRSRIQRHAVSARIASRTRRHSDASIGFSADDLRIVSHRTAARACIRYCQREHGDYRREVRSDGYIRGQRPQAGVAVPVQVPPLRPVNVEPAAGVAVQFPVVPDG